jgi:hypothetical protein
MKRGSKSLRAMASSSSHTSCVAVTGIVVVVLQKGRCSHWCVRGAGDIGIKG